VVLGVFSAGLFALTYVGFVRTVRGQSFDDVAFSGRIHESARVIDFSNSRLHALTIGSLLGAISMIIAIAVIRVRPRLGVAVAILVGGSVASAEVIKHLLPRPRLTAFVGGQTFNTFPSGHTTVAASLAVAFMMVVPARWRSVLGLFAGAYAIVIGMSTLSAGWHRASDAAAAYLLVAVWTSAVCIALILWQGWEPPDLRHRWLIVRGPVATTLFAAGAAAMGTAGGIGMRATFRAIGSPAALTTAQTTTAYRSGLLVISAVGCLFYALFLAAVREISFDPPPGHRRLGQLPIAAVSPQPATDA
jgi:membrane-associated phospholipid phosphatase